MLFMKRSQKILVLAVAGILCNPVSCAEESHSVAVTSPQTGPADLATSHFWTPSTIALVALDAAAKSADAYATRRNLDGGGIEYNPLARPFVHATPVQVIAITVLLGSEITVAYWLHRRRHDIRGHSVLAGGAVMNGLGAACSFKNRTANW